MSALLHSLGRKLLFLRHGTTWRRAGNCEFIYLQRPAFRVTTREFSRSQSLGCNLITAEDAAVPCLKWHTDTVAQRTPFSANAYPKRRRAICPRPTLGEWQNEAVQSAAGATRMSTGLPTPYRRDRQHMHKGPARESNFLQDAADRMKGHRFLNQMKKNLALRLVGVCGNRRASGSAVRTHTLEVARQCIQASRVRSDCVATRTQK